VRVWLELRVRPNGSALANLSNPVGVLSVFLSVDPVSSCHEPVVIERVRSFWEEGGRDPAQLPQHSGQYPRQSSPKRGPSSRTHVHNGGSPPSLFTPSNRHRSSPCATSPSSADNRPSSSASSSRSRRPTSSGRRTAESSRTPTTTSSTTGTESAD
jgi:hypothetical protein